MAESLIPARTLFRFSSPCQYLKNAKLGDGYQLGEEYALPFFGELEGRLEFAKVCAAWHEKGIVFQVQVTGKHQLPWCREARQDESDGLQLWIDTRDTHNVHRATRFCHRFVFLPGGGGRRLDEPVADQLLINRARENAPPIRPGELKVWCKRSRAGYNLLTFIPADSLNGYDPTDHNRLGFTYQIADRELGEQTYTAGIPLPYHEDPAIWGTLELVR